MTRFLPTLSAIFVFIIGVLVLSGWMFDISSLKAPIAGTVSMNPVTAATLMIAAVSLVLVNMAHASARSFGRACSAIVLTSGFLKILAILGIVNVGLDTLLFHAQMALKSNPQGPIAPNTAFCFLMSGLALVLIDVRGGVISQWLALAPALGAMLALLGYIYRVPGFYNLDKASPMAIHTGIAFSVLSIGIMFSRPACGYMAVVTSDTAGGYLSRRILPSVLLLFPILGWAGLAGQRAGLYSPEFGIAILVTAMMVILTLISMATSYKLMQGDFSRREVEVERDRYFAVSADLLCVLGFDGRFKRFNPAFERVFGASEEIQDSEFSTLVHPEELNTWHTHLDAVLRGGVLPRLHLMTRNRNGEHRWISWTAVPDAERRVIYMAGRDTTERLAAEARIVSALRDTENAHEKIRSLVNSIASGVLVTDLSDSITYMNPAAEKLLGFELASMPDKSVAKCVSEPALCSNLLTALAERRTGSRFDFTAQDGAIMLARMSVVHGKNDAVLGMVTTIEDVTAEREVDRMKTEFLATAAHELRTPLTSIRGFSEILLTRSLSDEKRKTFLETINKQSTHLGNIVNDLLDLAKIESGRGLVLKRSPTDLVSVTHELVQDHSSRSKIHQFSVESNREQQKVFCDPDKMRQVLGNLLSNSTKYSPAGGRVVINYNAVGSELVCSVSDEGVGMTPEQLARVFEKFYRADSSMTAIEGTGLGMPIVKAIIEQHGGKIYVESLYGKGTRVTFKLPRQATDTIDTRGIS